MEFKELLGLQRDEMGRREHAARSQKVSILLLQANKLAYHCFMDSGRRHKTPVSEMMGSLLSIVIAIARIPANFAISLNFP